jgi:hypothetical protein
MPFSNSDEGCAFTENWCDRCVHDKPARRGDEGNGCGILLVALCGQTPGEWIEQAWGEKGPPIDRYHCIEFRDENEGPPPRTEPLPTPPGQGELIPVEPYVATRMFSDVVAEIKAVDA